MNQMAAMATGGQFCDGPIPRFVQNISNTSTKFGAFITK